MKLRNAVLSNTLAVIFSVFLMSIGLSASAGEMLKPFVLGHTSNKTLSETAVNVRRAAEDAGFEIVGQFRTHSYATTFVITNDALKQAASKSEFGGYGAAIRVSVTKPWVKGEKKDTMVSSSGPIEVSYNNPVYLANAYRWSDGAVQTAAAVAIQLGDAFGDEATFGAFNRYADEGGISAKDLRKYHYMFGMEYFDDPSELAEYDDYDEAMKAVEEGLAEGRSGAKKVYQIDIPGKDETVFGVALTADDCSGDKVIMSRIDHGVPRNTSHAPYEILVSDGDVYALYARFRIAISWLGLPMIQSDTGATFFNIMCAPNAIEEALINVAGGD